MKTKEISLTIDPPSGWKYGFPKAVTQEQYKSITDLKQWCIDNGYPKSEADSYGKHFHIQINGDLSFMNEKLSMEKQADLIESEFYKEKPNQKQFKQLNESLFKAYIDKFDELKELIKGEL